MRLCAHRRTGHGVVRLCSYKRGVVGKRERFEGEAFAKRLAPTSIHVDITTKFSLKSYLHIQTNRVDQGSRFSGLNEYTCLRQHVSQPVREQQKGLCFEIISRTSGSQVMRNETPQGCDLSNLGPHCLPSNSAPCTKRSTFTLHRIAGSPLTLARGR